MRIIQFLFLTLTFVLLCGCENPIQSVGVTANPDGTFGVNATLKNGQVLRYARVSASQLAEWQRKYPTARVVYHETRAVSACDALTRSFAEIQAVQDRELALCSQRDALAEVVQLKPSLARRTRNFFAGRPILSFKGTQNCNCASSLVEAVEVAPPPAAQTPTSLVPSFAGGGGEIPTPTNPDGSFSIGKGMTLEQRVSALEAKADLILAKLGGK